MQCPFFIKILTKGSVNGTYLKTIQPIYDKPTVSITLNGEKPENIPIKSGKDKMTALTTIQYSVISPSHSNQTGNKIKDVKTKKEGVKLLLLVYADDMIPYIENFRDTKQKLLGLIHKFNKAGGVQY